MSLLCKIADLITEVPETGGLAPRCQEYLLTEHAQADITIREELYDTKRWSVFTFDDIAYMESARQFYRKLLEFSGLYLHSSAVEYKGKSYLFSGPCGMGKSTHTRLWQKVFGADAHVFNDDKPALRRLDGKWYAYGTPWCGKDGINQNIKVPLAGICFLKQSPINRIHRLSTHEALTKTILQTIRKYTEVEQLPQMDLMLSLVEQLIFEIPIFELENKPEPEAVLLSYETMRAAAEEAGL